MGRACSICSHPAKEVIDSALVSGTPNRRVAAQYLLAETSIRRHKRDHLPGSLVAAREVQDMTQASDLLREAQALKNRALRIFDKAEKAKDYRAATSAIREARGCVDLWARLMDAALRFAAEEERRRLFQGRGYEDLPEEELDDDIRRLLDGLALEGAPTAIDVDLLPPAFRPQRGGSW